MSARIGALALLLLLGSCACAALAAAPAPVAAPSEHAPTHAEEERYGRTVVARLVSGPSRFPACGIIAFVGVYVYDVEELVSGLPLSGRIVVDLLCPDFYTSQVGFRPGERHRLYLVPASPSYAGTHAPASPLVGAPRFEARWLVSVP
jgi:hypothetical protein